MGASEAMTPKDVDSVDSIDSVNMPEHDENKAEPVSEKKPESLQSMETPRDAKKYPEEEFKDLRSDAPKSKKVDEPNRKLTKQGCSCVTF